MTIDEMLLAGQSALLDLVFGPVAEGGESPPASTAPLAGPPVGTHGATSSAGAQPSTK